MELLVKTDWVVAEVVDAEGTVEETTTGVDSLVVVELIGTCWVDVVGDG